jgi:cyclopropane-fatty-acyl-phospholipid synthase
MNAQKLFINLLDEHILDARVCLRVNGTELMAGQGPSRNGDGAAVTVRVNHPRFFSRVLTEGNLGLGESYMNHEFEIENGALDDFLLVLLRNRLDRQIRLSPGAAMQLLWMRIMGTLRGKEDNIHRHYDTGDDLFQTFLDSNLVYSCGYANDPNDDLEQLQINKLDRICRKLRLQPGQSVLDIGCGYGGLLIYAAKNYGVRGDGVTISHHHREQGNKRVEQENLGGRVTIRYGDFSKVSGTYDRVVSVGMMEHVPRAEYDRYISKIARVLTADGVGLVHTLGANAPKNRHDPFFQKYIFPNSNQPRLSEITANLEKHGLAILDVENMIRHYAYTVKRWQERFLQNRGSLDPTKYDDRFMRMWEYYLGCGVAAAFASDSALYQVLFTKSYTVPIPLHRV